MFSTLKVKRRQKFVLRYSKTIGPKPKKDKFLGLEEKQSYADYKIWLKITFSPRTLIIVR
jgi:hypothetical protein